MIDEIGLDRYRFGHALVRATLLDELTTTRRVRTHRKIAETIEAQHAGDLDAVVTELAYHYGEAAAAEPEKAIEYAVRAAETRVRVRGGRRRRSLVRAGARARRAVTATRPLRGRAAHRLGAGRVGRGYRRRARAHLRDAARRAKTPASTRRWPTRCSSSTRTSFDEEQESDPEKIELLERRARAIRRRPGAPGALDERARRRADLRR